MRTAIVSTYPPRACGIGTFAADVRAALLGVDGVDRVERVVVVNEPSSPQRRGPGRDDRPGGPRRLRARRPDPRPARRRRRPAPARVRHLRRRATASTCSRSPRSSSQPLVVTLHTVLSEPTPHQAEVLTAALPRGRARDRDDRDGAAAARRERRLRRRRRCASCRTERHRSRPARRRRARRAQAPARRGRDGAIRSGSCSRRSG